MEKNILDLLNKKDLTFTEIRKLLKVGKDKKEDLLNLLNKLELEGKIYLDDDKYILFPYNYEICKVEVSSNKKLFVHLDKLIYIEPIKSNGCINQDTIVFDKDNKEVKKVLKRKYSNLVFEVKIIDDIKTLKVFDSPNDINVRISSRDMKRLHEGDRILVDVSILKDDDYYEGNYIKTIGNINDPDIELKSIAEANGFSYNFSDESIKELDNINDEVTNEEILERVDLRDEVIFTIDGSDTKDMDDAISIKKLDNGNYLLGVHIADVSHYISEESSLNNDARSRGTSLYMINSVIPMFPKKISNGICSLNPGVDRLTLSCIMEVDNEGEIVDYKFTESVINSKMKMSYEEVNKVLDNKDYKESYEKYKDDLLMMYELSEILNIKKEKRGFLRFGDIEVKLHEEDGKITDVVKKGRGKSEELIENFMVLANTCVATHLSWISFIPMIYRNHGSPNMTKINNTIDFIASLGYRIKNARNLDNVYFIQKVLHDLSNKDEFPILSTLILRSMKKANYNTEDLGHYALEIPHYTHFTSPIRRFPDLEVHRVLKIHTSLNLEYIDFNEMEKELQAICSHSSYMERQADIAESEALQLKMCEYMKEHIGEYFNCYVNDINKDGILIQTDNKIPGIIKYENIGSYNRDKKCIVDEDNKAVIKIGYNLLVKAINVDTVNRLTEFEIEKNLTLVNKEINKEKNKYELINDFIENNNLSPRLYANIKDIDDEKITVQLCNKVIGYIKLDDRYKYNYNTNKLYDRHYDKELKKDHFVAVRINEIIDNEIYFEIEKNYSIENKKSRPLVRYLTK